MPRKSFIPTQLPPEQPDRCADCPLLGLIPKEQRPKGSKETHVCIGTHHAISGRGILVRKSQRDSHHPLRRPCDSKWEAWMTLPGRTYGMPYTHYLLYRMPYEQGQQMKIIFHRN